MACASLGSAAEYIIVFPIGGVPEIFFQRRPTTDFLHDIPRIHATGQSACKYR